MIQFQGERGYAKSYVPRVTIHRFRKCPFTPLCIEDAERVGDPILFERPCKCIEDARSLVLRLDLAKCLAEEL